jgi:hypothetical protein
VKPDKKATKKIKKKPEKSQTKSTIKSDKKNSGESRFGQILTRIGHGFFLTVLAVAVVGVAVAAGAYVTYEVQKNIWEQKFQNENKLALVDKRIELLEITTTLMSKSLAVKNMEKADPTKAASVLVKLGLDPTKIVDVITESLDRKTLAKCRFLESNTEYATTMRQNRIFFGDSTRTIIDRLERADPWWSITKKQRNSLIEAMEYDFLSGYATETYLNSEHKAE